MVFEHGIEQVPLHHRECLTHGANRAGPPVAIESEASVQVANGVEEGGVFRFGRLPRGLE